MSKIMDLINDENAVIIWDVDGVLAAYEYGERNHNAVSDAEWIEYLRQHHTYENARPLTTIQKWMADHGNPERMYVCTKVEDGYELKQKVKFVTKNYPIKKENIYHSKKDDHGKLTCINGLKLKYPGLEDKYFIMVDDSVSVLNWIQENSNFSTMHISSFME